MPTKFTTDQCAWCVKPKMGLYPVRIDNTTFKACGVHLSIFRAGVLKKP
jgi:hypothetical protein